MPPPLQSPTILHPNQVLTVKKAACWVQYLIDFYSYNVWVLPPFTLEEGALDGYVERLGTVIGHAGALEQLLCRMSFFLPDEVVQTVVAIHEQVDCFVVSDTLLANMSDYMEQVLAHLHAIHSWVQSGEYSQLSQAVDDALSGMRRSFSAFLAQMDDDPPVMAPVTRSTSREPPGTHHKISSSQITLDSLLNILSQHQFAHSSSLPEADRVMLKRNFVPLISSPRPSLKGKERCLYEDDDSTRSTVPTSTNPTNGRPDAAPLPPVPPPSQFRAGVKRRRSHSESYHLSKRQRVSVRLYGVDGCLSDCSTHEATLAQVQPHIGQSVPLHPRLSPSTLPPPPNLAPSHSSISVSGSVSAPADIASFNAGPSSSQSSSASRSPSPPLSVDGDRLVVPRPFGDVPAPPAPFRSTFPSPFGGFPLPLPRVYGGDSSLDSQGFTNATPDADAYSDASDDSESEAASYVTASSFVEDEYEMDSDSEDGDASDPIPSASMDVDIDASPSRLVAVPAKTTGTIKQRRCLEGLLQTIRQIFRSRT
ncbi:hypothetical protein C8Q80DRAFT_378285 [Daedaleopsis nitida]|nr:hypothetical protein C8Q80DRAFT_378285 [Daedaleopsis nitida]